MKHCGTTVTKGRASLVIEAEGEAEEQGARAGVAETEVTGMCNCITTWPLH